MVTHLFHLFFFTFNRNKKIPTNDLALFINALTVACVDPKDFFGTNLVDELRIRVKNNNRTNPFSILTLCNAKDTMTMDDVDKLQQEYDAHLRPMWTGNESFVFIIIDNRHKSDQLIYSFYKCIQ